MEAMRVLVCLFVLAVVADAQCKLATQTITLPSNIPANALTMALSVPSNVKVQTVSGTSWGVAANQDADHLKFQAAYDSKLNIVSLTITTKPNAASLSSSSPFVLALSFISCLFLMRTNVDMRLLLVILGLSYIPFVLSGSGVDCTNGTVIVTVPTSGTVTVNGISTLGCSDNYGYFNASLCTATTTPAGTTTTTHPPVTTPAGTTTTTQPPVTTPAGSTTTHPPTTTPKATTTPVTTTTAPPVTTAASTTPATTTTTLAPSSCSIQTGIQCWGQLGSGAQCAGADANGCCPGCCANGGQCGGSSTDDNAYWKGCRPSGTSGGPTVSCPGSSTPATTPTPTNGPTPAPGSYKKYCPSSNDIVVAYGSPTIVNQGWTINGGGGVATKSAYDLNNGWISYTVHVAGVPAGVNANIYSISPNFNGASQFSASLYCDGQPAGAKGPWCVEIDYLESNGNCCGQSTLHTYNVADNSGGCGGWGCYATYLYNGITTYTMNISFDSTGHWTVLENGNLLGTITPAAGAVDWTNLFNAYTNQGAVIYSTQWVGYVPSCNGCANSGDLNSASFSISNLQIYGAIVQGPAATVCP